MTEDETWVRCADCGTVLRPSDKKCPKCGSARKAYDVKLSDSLVLKDSVQEQLIRGYEFEQYLFQLLTLNENFRNVTIGEKIRVRDSAFRPDIVAEENVDGDWQQIIIECKSATTFTRDRLYSVIHNLKHLQIYFPKSRLVLSFLGKLSSDAYQALKNERIEIWDLSYLAKKFITEIPKVQKPIHLYSLLSGVQPSPIKSAEEILIDKLNLCRPGKPDWVSFQNLVGSILEQLFCPPLSNPLPENTDIDAVNRRDFILPNYVEEGFWSFMRSKYSADYIVVDAKNYAGKVKKREALQITNYLKPHGVGLFGLIICRNGCDRSCTLTLREAWIIERKLIIILEDYDLKQMLVAKSSGTQPESIIRQKIEDFRLGL